MIDLFTAPNGTRLTPAACRNIRSALKLGYDRKFIAEQHNIPVSYLDFVWLPECYDMLNEAEEAEKEARRAAMLPTRPVSAFSLFRNTPVQEPSRDDDLSEAVADTPAVVNVQPTNKVREAMHRSGINTIAKKAEA